ncbi:MAG: hypothetical protein M1839_008682 [Geoglossum umbratile]|nr:MAG: hypothetical protein M1839_008682 [Geoglossum umbratile]
MQSRYGDAAGIESMTLQKDIHFVLQRCEDFDDMAINRYLQEFPDDRDDRYYNERFTTQVWKDLLVMQSCPNRPLQSGQVMYSVITGLSEVKNNPALNTQQALDDLFIRIQPLVVQWALDQCDISLRLQFFKTSNHWPPVKLEFVKTERSKFSHLLKVMGTAFPSRELEGSGLVRNPPVQVVVDKANLVNTKTRLEVTLTATPEGSLVQIPVQIADGDRTVTIPRRISRIPPSRGSESLSPEICDSDCDGNLRNGSQVRGLSRLQKKPSRTSSTPVLSATLPKLGTVSSSNERQLDQDPGADTNRNASTEANDADLSADTSTEESTYSLPSSDDSQPIPSQAIEETTGKPCFGSEGSEKGSELRGSIRRNLLVSDSKPCHCGWYVQTLLP